jgi:hypothetical protein
VIPRSLAHRETDIAEALLPGARLDGATVVRSGSHDVVLLPDVAAIRIARNPPAVAALPRRTALLTELAKAGLPFATPTPLGPVSSTPDWTAVAVSWIPGHPAPSGTGDPATLREVLDALAAVDLAPLADLLDVPHAYAGREHWEQLLLTEAVPRLPGRLRDSARGHLRACSHLVRHLRAGADRQDPARRGRPQHARCLRRTGRPMDGRRRLRLSEAPRQ